jgi:hypothetical protein
MLELAKYVGRANVYKLQASSFVKRVNSAGKIVLNETNIKLKPDKVEKRVMLRMNRKWMCYLHGHQSRHDVPSQSFPWGVGFHTPRRNNALYFTSNVDRWRPSMTPLRMRTYSNTSSNRLFKLTHLFALLPKNKIIKTPVAILFTFRSFKNVKNHHMVWSVHGQFSPGSFAGRFVKLCTTISQHVYIYFSYYSWRLLSLL